MPLALGSFNENYVTPMSKEIDLRRKSVLIVECDSIKLANQSLSVGCDIFRILKLLFRNNPIEIVQTTTEAKLLDTIHKLTETKRKFRNMPIGLIHHNQSLPYGL